MKQYFATKQISLVIFTILLSLYFSQFALSQGNLVVNGSFDTDASGWSITNVFGSGYDSTEGNPPGDVQLLGPSSSSPENPTASQMIYELIPKDVYEVSGDYDKISGKISPSSDSFGVALDGIIFFETPDPGTFNWNSFSFYYTATSTSTLLSLEAQMNGTDYAYAIDNISMMLVPEPSAWTLLLLGGGVFIYVRTRKHHSA